jgi:hypothetical protein
MINYLSGDAAAHLLLLYNWILNSNKVRVISIKKKNKIDLKELGPVANFKNKEKKFPNSMLVYYPISRFGRQVIRPADIKGGLSVTMTTQGPSHTFLLYTTVTQTTKFVFQQYFIFIPHHLIYFNYPRAVLPECQITT